MPGKLLVVLDGGSLDMEVAVQAVVMAKEQGAQLRVVYLCVPPPAPLESVVVVAEGVPLMAASQELAADQAAHGHRVLAKVRALAEDAGVMVRIRLVESTDPVREVAQQAWVHQCELIVVAVHSDSLWQRVWGTSFTAQLLAKARVPVLFCPPGRASPGRVRLHKAGLRASYRRLGRDLRRNEEDND